MELTPMTTHNSKNERIKREYFTYLKEAKRYSEATLDGVVKALHRFENYTKFKDFKNFHIQQAVAFKAHLSDQRNRRTDKPLSKSTLYSTLAALKNFFQWLAGRPGFKSRLSYADADYFNLSEKDTRVAKIQRELPVPTLEQIRHVIKAMPVRSEIEQRNRALIAFAILTGARDGAIASFKLKHIDLVGNLINQDAREVKTKFSKSFTTYFFPVGDDFMEIVRDWESYLREEKLWGLEDPVFPATHISLGKTGGFEATGLARKQWSTAGPIRKIFKEAFNLAGLPYFNPHSFRKTLALFGEKVCQTPEEFKAWSQNLGHEKVLTTFYSYGNVSPRRQAEIISQLGPSNTPEDVLELAEQLFKAAKRSSGAS